MSTVASDKRVNEIQNSLVLLTNECLQENSSVKIISLKHPGHGILTKYLLNKKSKKLQEIQTFGETHRSWLIDETLRANGNLYISTPIDPVFLILPYVKKQCMKRAIPLEHILEAADEPHFNELYFFITDLKCIADLKGPKDLMAYQYNEEKTLNWLKEKTEKVARYLEEKNVYVKTGAISATFVSSTLNEEKIDSDAYLRFAFGIVSEYLNDDFCNILSTHLNIKEDAIPNIKRKITENSPVDNKKIKLEKNESILDNVISSSFNDNIKSEPKAKVSKPTQSLKEKQKQKAAVGSKSIKSFFSKK